jgi:hypothetical protein
MKRLVFSGLVAVPLLLSACTGGGAQGSLTLDDGATRACQALNQLIADRSGLDATQLRDRVATVYQEAQSSSNAIIQARAVALYADATVIASGGESNLDADLTSMQKACSGGTGS